MRRVLGVTLITALDGTLALPVVDFPSPVRVRGVSWLIMSKPGACPFVSIDAQRDEVMAWSADSKASMAGWTSSSSSLFGEAPVKKGVSEKTRHQSTLVSDGKSLPSTFLSSP